MFETVPGVEIHADWGTDVLNLTKQRTQEATSQGLQTMTPPYNHSDCIATKELDSQETSPRRVQADAPIASQLYFIAEVLDFRQNALAG